MAELQSGGKSFTVAGEKDAIDPLVKQLALAVFADAQPNPDAFAILNQRAWMSAFGPTLRLNASIQT